MTKRQLAKLSNTPFYPTVTDAKKWTQVLNCILFGGSLPPYNKIKVRRMKSCYAQLTCEIEEPLNCFLEIHNKFSSFGAFFSVLAHELVHHADFVKYQDTEKSAHGRFFYSHKDLLKAIGLCLYEKY